MKLVIFDMDGLMFATEGIDMQCFKKACNEFGYTIEEEFQMGLIGMNEHDTILKLQAKFGEAFPVYDIRALSWKMKMEYFYEKGLPIKKGLKELVSYLKEMKIKIAVASSSSIKIINEYLQLSDLENQFDYIVGGDKVVHSKPDPEIFLKVLEHFNFDSSEALVLEDSNNGILASHRANIPVICVSDLVENKPELLALTYKTLPSLLEVKDEIAKILEGSKC